MSHKDWIKFLADNPDDVSVKVTKEQADAEKCGVVICRLVTTPLMFPDNLVGHCSKCWRMVQFRPYAPKTPPRICDECALPMLKAQIKDEPIAAMITENSLAELLNYAKTEEDQLMSWHTLEIRPGNFAIMDGDREIGWITDLGRWHVQIGGFQATFAEYISALAYVQGVEAALPPSTPLPIVVRGNDYTYDGWIVARFPKRKSGEIRYVVEDENGRLFIHNGKQIGAE